MCAEPIRVLNFWMCAELRTSPLFEPEILINFSKIKAFCTKDRELLGLQLLLHHHASMVYGSA
jgi:hypothetical protein